MLLRPFWLQTADKVSLRKSVGCNAVSRSLGKRLGQDSQRKLTTYVQKPAWIPKYCQSRDFIYFMESAGWFGFVDWWLVVRSSKQPFGM